MIALVGLLFILAVLFENAWLLLASLALACVAIFIRALPRI